MADKNEQYSDQPFNRAAEREARARGPRERQAGIAKLFSAGQEMAPGVLAFQKSLVGGLARGAALEQKRLEQRKAPKARLEAGAARGARMEGLVSALSEIKSVLGHVQQGLAEPGIFHGYVRLASGAAAVDHQVVAAFADRANCPVRKVVKTDANGYFRMTLAPDGKEKPRNNAGGKEQAVEVLILDASGKEVYRDPFPPELQADTASAFRFYPLLGKDFVPDRRREPAEKEPVKAETPGKQDAAVKPDVKVDVAGKARAPGTVTADMLKRPKA